MFFGILVVMICVQLHDGLLILKAVQWYNRCLFYAYFNISSTLINDCNATDFSLQRSEVCRILLEFRVIMSFLLSQSHIMLYIDCAF